MKSLMKNVFLTFNKVKVIHSIPGRMRLNAPGLNQVPEEFKKFEGEITKVIKVKKGIKEIDYSYLTNKILLKYDVKVVSEKEVLEWIDIIWKEVLKLEEATDETGIITNIKEVHKKAILLCKL